jgi:predicted SpoU family rRNA methylase
MALLVTIIISDIGGVGRRLNFHKRFMSEIWSLAAAINVKQVMPQIETSVDKINIMALARRIERKYKNPANWNYSVNEQCDPGIKALLILP